MIFNFSTKKQLASIVDTLHAYSELNQAVISSTQHNAESIIELARAMGELAQRIEALEKGLND
jgi:hypothetical protein